LRHWGLNPFVDEAQRTPNKVLLAAEDGGEHGIKEERPETAGELFLHITKGEMGEKMN